MRKFMDQYPHAYWSDFVPHALMMLRFTAHRAHGLPPYTVITGQQPPLPPLINNPQCEATTFPELTAEQEQLYADWVHQRAITLYQLVLTRRTKAYTRLLARFKRLEKSHQPLSTISIFKEGDLVLRRSRVMGKLQAKADGPYRVLKVAGQFG